MPSQSQDQERLFITGASSGLGLAIALEALDRGHKVIGTARDITKAASANPEFEQAGGSWLQLDLTASDTQSRVAQAVEAQDTTVLVNNAGYGLYGALEDMSEEEIRAQMETNFFGTLKVIKGAIPHFRTKRRGTIVVMSSISGLTVSRPSGLIYSASKFSLEAIAEGLELQLAPFGVKMLLVEPGLFRTNWLAGSYATAKAGLSEDYRGTPTDTELQEYPTMHNKQAGSPAKAAKAVIDVVTKTGDGANIDVQQCLRLLLGNGAIEKAREHVKRLTDELDAMEHVTRGTDYEI